MALLNFPGHKRYRCTDRCTGCVICDGGLFLCTHCGGAEGSLPTDCPGEKMSWTREIAVYCGLLDYDRRLGWVERNARYIWRKS